ncbi:MAG: 23S rRNA (uracil(1939)-C(5))-methyltransferase RlmD [Gammaproteobacteria bacterium]
MSRRKSKPLNQAPVRARIESLSHDGRGVAHIDGKTVFIDGALPDEEVTFRYLSKHRKFDQGQVVEVVTPSADRVEPRCPHFGLCGGCSLQHMEPGAQILAKQKILLENLQRIGGVEPDRILEPLTGPHWGYRNRARLGARYVIKKARVLVGFRERHKSFIADLTRCEVLHPSVGLRITELAELIQKLSIRAHIPQIEVAVGQGTTALVLRHLEPLDDDDVARLAEFGRSRDLHIYLQPGGVETVTALWPEDSQLNYQLPRYDIEINFRPTDFVQINPDINIALVDRVVECLNPGPDDRVLDLFCGLGNLSLPLARNAGQVVGVERDVGLLQRAGENAQRNGIENAQFHSADLTQDISGSPWAKSAYNKILLDPPRCGAKELMHRIPKWEGRQVVYVSCHPGSLARDACALVNDYGYRLVSAGVMDMFPHNTHVESISVFEK